MKKMALMLAGLALTSSLAACTSNSTAGSSGREVWGNPVGTDVQGNPNDKNADGVRPKNADGNPPEDIYGNKIGVPTP